MKTIIELDEKDIREAIAEKVGCDAQQVSLCAERQTREYGHSVRDYYCMSARIDKSLRIPETPVLNGSGLNELASKIYWPECDPDGAVQLKSMEV